MNRGVNDQPEAIDDCSKLELRIHVLGCYPKGESILIVLWDEFKQKVLKSIMVDCYKDGNTNRFDDLFKFYKLRQQKLDYFIWTHPDEDHSVGIPEIINNYTEKKSLIFVPWGLSKKIFSLGKYNLKTLCNNVLKWSGTIQSLIYVLKCSRKRPSIVEPVSASKHVIRPSLYGWVFQDLYGKKCNFFIEILTPFSDKSFTKTETNSSLLKNDISISFNIKFDKVVYFFGGDIENKSIQEIDKCKLKDTVFVKIPHHAATTSTELPVKYHEILKNSSVPDKQMITAVSTAFENNANIHLPNPTVLESYKDCSRNIYVTKKKTTQKNNYGIVTLVYKYQSAVLAQKKFEGDCEIYYEKPIKRGPKKH